MANYLTIQQASNTTGKSTRTIRRLCYNEKSKDFITHDEKNRLLIDANYLAQHYPMSNIPQTVQPSKNDNGKRFAMSKDTTIDNDKPQENTSLLHKIALLEQELNYERRITNEKDKRIEVLERSLLLLGQGQKKDIVQSEPLAPDSRLSEVTPEQQMEEPAPKRAWWKIF